MSEIDFRRVDALLATALDDWERYEIPLSPSLTGEPQGPIVQWRSKSRGVYGCNYPTAYSTTGDGMLLVIEAMTTGRGYRFSLEWLPKRGIHGKPGRGWTPVPLWSASFYTTSLQQQQERGITDYWRGRGQADFPPRAVTLAACKTLRLEVPGG